MEIEAHDPHPEAAELDVHVRASSELLHRRQPFAVGAVAITAIRPHAERASDVIQYDGRVRKRLREIGELRDLRVVEPGIERQSQRSQPREALAEVRIRHLPRRRPPQQAGVELFVPRGDVPDAAEATGARRHMGVQYFLDLVAERQVRRADDPGAGAEWELPALGLLRNAGDELGLPDRTQRFGAALAIGEAALDEYRRLNVVPGIRVTHQFIEKISAVVVPKMVMRIDDG